MRLYFDANVHFCIVLSAFNGFLSLRDSGSTNFSNHWKSLLNVFFYRGVCMCACAWCIVYVQCACGVYAWEHISSTHSFGCL